MAMDAKTLIYNVEKAVGINAELQNQTQKAKALAKPIDYQKDYMAKLEEIKKQGEAFITAQLQHYAASGLDQDQINQLVGQESVSRYQNELNAVSYQFPYLGIAQSQIVTDRAPRIALGRTRSRTSSAMDVDAPVKRRKRRASAAPKRAAPKRVAPKPAKKRKVTKRKTTKKR